ncbi:MAG: DUF285 domain-containing protein [Lactobacillaceae bacterium]|jgi:surface protein|nr:DUF285 domain-containing protein [Lactobacillaceae bacterium]
MKRTKLIKKFAQTLALVAVVAGGAITPAASIVIPGIESVVHAAVTAENTFGTCHWVLEDGVLTVEKGTLGVTNQLQGDWTEYRTDITKIIIEPGVIANEDSQEAFYNLTNLTIFEGGQNLDVSHVTNMRSMFGNCNKLISINVSNWNVASVQDMDYIFQGCWAVTALDVSHWNTANVEQMVSVFNNCYALKKINVTGWTVAQAKNMSAFFGGCRALTTLDLSTWSTSLQVPYMFYQCDNLWKLTLGANFKVTNVGQEGELVAPIPGTEFNMNFTVKSALWREIDSVSGGSAINPLGDEVSAINVLAHHAASNKTETYVWQGTLGDTTVDYTVEPSYTITIPTGITIDSTNKYGSGAVVLGANPKLPYEESLITIGVTSSAWKLTKEHDDTGVAYKFGTSSTGDDLKNGGKLTFNADGTNPLTESRTVYASVLAGSQFKYAGTYTDTVNYTIETLHPEPK